MICWVVGASGKIGRSLSQRLLVEGHQVVGIGRGTIPTGVELSWITWDPATQRARPKGLPHPDTVFLLSGQTSAHVARSDVAGDVEANVVAVARVVTEAASNECTPHVISAGAATEAPLDHVGLAPEGSTNAPASFYETAKAAQRLYLAQFAREGAIDFTTLRLSNVYGGQRSSTGDRGFMDRCIEQAVAGEPVAYFSDAPYARDYLFLDDAVTAFLLASEHRQETRNTTFDIGTGTTTTIHDALMILRDIVASQFGREVELVPTCSPSGLSRVDAGDRSVDAEVFRRKTGWSARTDLRTGLRVALERSVKNELGG